MNDEIRYMYPIVLWSVDVIYFDEDVALALDRSRRGPLASARARWSLPAPVLSSSSCVLLVAAWGPRAPVPGRFWLRSYSEPSWPS